MMSNGSSNHEAERVEQELWQLEQFLCSLQEDPNPNPLFRDMVEEKISHKRRRLAELRGVRRNA